LARELTADTDTGSLVGTIAYLAPEVIRRGKTEKASDIYSFGIMLYEMLTGVQPYRGDDAMQIAFMHISQRVPSAATSNPSVDENLDQLMIWCTEPVVEDRPEHAQEVLDWLAEVEFDEPDLAQTLLLPAETNFTEVIGEFEEVEEPFKKFKARRIGFRWVLASVLAVTLGGFGGWWYGSGPGALVPIPNLADTTQSQASQQLKEITDSVTTKEIFSDSFTIGTVVGTEPAAGILVPRNSTITILVSKGKELVSVPNVIGLDLVTASAQIISSRLTVGKVSEWFSSEYPLGTVYSYSNKNTKVPVTSSVDLKVSLGSIPVVSGLQSSVAKAALEAAGLVVRKTTFKYSTTAPKGEVISVTPDEPEVGKGSSVKLVVSKGPATVTMPKVKGETILAAKALLESLGLKVVIDTKWLTKDYGIKRVTGASESAGTTIKVGQSVTIRSR
jgi:serine/threonine-protein kinase